MSTETIHVTYEKLCAFIHGTGAHFDGVPWFRLPAPQFTAILF
jgi:hypothetical protein